MDAITSFLGNYTGNVSKAVISVFDMRGELTVPEPPVEAGGGSGPAGVTGRVGGAATDLVQTDALRGITDTPTLERLVQNAAGQSTSEFYQQTPDPIRKTAEDSVRRDFTVQFNPSTLHVGGRAGGMVPMQHFDPNDKEKKHPTGMSYEAMSPRISMDCQLIFDAEDNADCFQSDKLQTNVTGIAKEVTKSIVKMAGGYKRTVQQQVEGFIAAIREENTRLIAFTWGDMCYCGILNHVRANYTMFNTIGEPVRATVAFSMLLMDESIGSTRDSVWVGYYTQAFAGNSSLTRAAQKTASSLINLSL